MYEARQNKEKVSRRIEFKPTATAILQRTRYEAGIGNDWHVHEDHVKYDGWPNTRIDFKGRSRDMILNSLQQLLQTLPENVQKSEYLQQCKKWINRYC